MEDKERLEYTILVLVHISRMLKSSESIDHQLGLGVTMHPDVKDPVREVRNLYAEDVDYAVSLLKNLL